MTSVSTTRASRFISVSSVTGKQNQPGKQAGEKSKPNQRRMPDEAIEAERRRDPVDHQEQRNGGQKVEQQRGRKRAEEDDFTQHRGPPAGWVRQKPGCVRVPAGRPRSCPKRGRWSQ